MARIVVVALTAGFVAATIGLAPTAADTPPRGNNWFEVIVEDPPRIPPDTPDAARDDGTGVFGAITGPGHPRGAGEDILAAEGGDDAYSSYITVRSYSTGTDYVQSSDNPGSGNRVVPLEQNSSTVPVDGGYEMNYLVPMIGQSAEALRVQAAVVVEGSGSASSIRISGSVLNETPHPIKVGARLILDISAGGDDGPLLVAGGMRYTEEAEPGSSGQPLVFEDSAGATRYSVRAAEGNADLVQLAHWDRAHQSAFDYTGEGRDVTSPGGLDDSALLIYFGASPDTASTLAQGETLDFSVLIADAASVEVCDNGSDDDGDGLTDGADPDCTGATPTRSPTPTAGPSAPATPTRSTVPSLITSSPPPAASGFPRTGGPLGIDGAALWLLGSLSAAVLVAGGAAAIALARRR